MGKITENQKGILALVLLSLLFASMGLFSRYLSTGFSILQQVYLRVLAAFVLGLIFFWRDLDFSKLKKISPKEWMVLTFRAAVSYLLGVTLFSKAMLMTKYSNVSFVSALPTTALLAALILKEKMSLKKFALILVAFVGVVLIAVKDWSNLLSWGAGEVVTLIATISFSMSYIGRRWQSNFLNNKEITQLTFLLSFVMIFASSIVVREGLPMGNWTWPLLAVVVGAGLFNTFNLFLTNYGFQKVEAILASNILMLESVFAIILGFVFYGEIPLWKELIGGAIIVTSVITMNYLEKIKKI